MVSGEGTTWELVFSDEFETEGRSFYPGDDPYWEAIDLHAWGTNDVRPFCLSSLSCERTYGLFHRD